MLFACVAGATASTRGPDAGGYRATDEAIYSFVDIVGPNGAATVLAGVDDGAVPLTLPFAFQFYGREYSIACVSSNGAIYLLTDAAGCGGVSDFANTDLATTAPPGDGPTILPFWSDLRFEAADGGVLYQSLGTAGSRRFVVQWNNALPHDSTAPVTFETILFEGTNRILFQYKAVDAGENPAAAGGVATVGIRNANGLASGQQIEWSFNTPVLGNESALLFSTGPSMPALAWPTPADVVYGTALGAAQLNATAPVPGTFVYSPAAGAVLAAGAQTLSVTFTPSDLAAYQPATSSVTLTVRPAALSIRANNASKVFGAPLPAFTATTTGFVNGDSLSSLSGTLGFTTPATAASNVGSYPITPAGVSSPNYTITLTPGTLAIAQATTTVAVAAAPSPGVVGQPVTFTATVSPVPPGAGNPTGSVTFLEGSTTLATVAVSAGAARFTTTTLNAATHTITARYGGDGNFTSSSASATEAVTASTVQLIAAATVVKNAAGQYVATITIRNGGNSAAAGTALTAATLNNVAGAPGAATLGTIAGGATVTLTETFAAAAGGSGTAGALRIQLNWNGGAATASMRVVLP